MLSCPSCAGARNSSASAFQSAEITRVHCHPQLMGSALTSVWSLKGRRTLPELPLPSQPGRQRGNAHLWSSAQEKLRLWSSLFCECFARQQTFLTNFNSIKDLRFAVRVAPDTESHMITTEPKVRVPAFPPRCHRWRAHTCTRCRTAGRRLCPGAQS